MFYYGYCEKCNYLDADLNEDDLFNTLEEHRLKKHPKKHPYFDSIHIIRVPFPFRFWLTAKTTASFWEGWRHHKQPAYVLARLEELKKLFPEIAFKFP